MEECVQLVSSLKLESSLKFTGRSDVKKYYPKIDVVVLTSLSEAQPYVILEANAAGIPVVATDVGACREMLEGRLPEDRELGPSGVLTRVSSAEDTAQAILKVLSSPDLWKRFSDSGRLRAQRFYDQADLLSQYMNLYEQSMR
jgi:glycosyltransferase involved in cell wall biosynthesis